mgnify:CR=1 FL=1
MKKRFLLFLSLFSIQIGFTQVNSSVLSSGDWYKFSVDTTGVFKIDRNLLQQIGISTSGLNPKKIHIYGNGGQLLPDLNSDFRYDDLQENSIYIEGENDGAFDSSDYIIFYAKGPHSWDVNPSTNTAKHKQNIYSDKGYYFITVNDVDGKRIQQKTPITTNSIAQISVFDDYIFYEKEEKSILAVGTQWFFNEDFNIENTQNFSIPFPNAISNQNINVRVRGVSNSVVSSTMDVKINGQDVYTINYPAVNSGSLTKAFASERNADILNSSEKVDVSITYNNNGNPSATAFLDFIEIVGKKQLKFSDFQFSFRSFEQANTNGIVEYQIENGDNAFQVWDVTDYINPKSIINESTANNFTFKDNGGTLKEYIIVNEADFYIPETIENSKVSNQDLHSLRDVNYIVITNSELSDEAQRLADYHQTNSNLTTKVVLLDEIYNEFSSGSKDITGIRDFIKHIYTTNSSAEKKLKYICFFGDSSYDYKDRIAGNNNIVPKTLDFARDITKLPKWINGISSYSMWWVIIQYQWYYNYGNLEYLKEQKQYLKKLLELLISKTENGKETLNGHRFLDWPTQGNSKAIHTGLQSLLIMTLEQGSELCDVLGEKELAQRCKNQAKQLIKHVPDHNNIKQAAALMVLSGISNPEEISNQVLLKNGAKGISIFTADGLTKEQQAVLVKLKQ